MNEEQENLSIKTTFSNMNKSIIEIIGWYGTAAILVAYALVSFSVIAASSPVYQLLNVSGAASIVIDAYAKHDYQPAVLNTVWALIALFALSNILLVSR